MLTRDLKELFEKHLPQLDLRLALYNNFKIKSYFPYKEKLPSGLCSSIVYQFTCSKCNLEYLGSSIKNLSFRIDQHRGISSRTTLPLVRPPQSTIRDHCTNICEVAVKPIDFKILFKSRDEQELRIAESIMIRLNKPALNLDGSSVPLYIL